MTTEEKTDNTGVEVVEFSSCYDRYIRDSKGVNTTFNTNVSLDTADNLVRYGADNLLPNTILYLYENSPTHSTCVTKKANYTSGGNLIIPEGQEGLKEELNKLNLNKGLHSLLNRCALDLHLFGGFCIQIIFYTHRRAIKDIIYQDFSQVRRGFNKEPSGELYEQDLLISPNWEQRYLYPPQRYKRFDWGMLDGSVDIPNEPVFLYYFRDNPGREWYPIPDWWAAHLNIETEIEGNNYVNNQMRNSFNPSGFLSVPAPKDANTAKELSKKLKKEFTGTNNAGKVVVVTKEKDSTIEWTPLTDTVDFTGILNVIDRNQRMILTGHSITSPTLVGLPSGPTLGGDGSTIFEAAKEFYNEVILKSQQELFGKVDRLLSATDNPYIIEVENNYVYVSNEDKKKIIGEEAKEEINNG